MARKKIFNLRNSILAGIAWMSIVGITLAVTSHFDPNAYI